MGSLYLNFSSPSLTPKEMVTMFRGCSYDRFLEGESAQKGEKILVGLLLKETWLKKGTLCFPFPQPV